jgi:transducin (beta)-like 1
MSSSETNCLLQSSRGLQEPVSGFFGPLALQEPRPAPIGEEDLENARKRQIEDEQLQPQTNGPPKRPRLTNGYVNGNGLDSTPRSPMEIDDEQNGDGNAYPSPEQLPSPVPATIGPERGTQVDKVSELSTETTFLDLTDETAARHNTILLQCEWNPRDPTILAAAGTDALARMWTFSRTAPSTATDADHDMQELGQPRVFPPHHNLLDEGVAPSTTATGLAWTSDGLHVAISSEAIDDGTAKIEVWNTDGTSVASFVAFESPVICLRWNLSNSLLLALSPDSDGTLITVMSPATQESVQTSLPRHNLIEQTLDAAWTSNEEFVLCGGDMLQAFHCLAGGISPARKYEVREGHALSKATFDWPSRLLATASDTGMIDVRSLASLLDFANAGTDLGPTRSMQFLQCSPGTNYLSNLAANAESCHLG